MITVWSVVFVGVGGPVDIRNSYAEVAVPGGTHQDSVVDSFFGTISMSYGVGLVSGASADIGGRLKRLLARMALMERTVSPSPTGGLNTAEMQVACVAEATTGICVLGSNFVFTEKVYPKVKKCTGACDADCPVFGTELVGGLAGKIGSKRFFYCGISLNFFHKVREVRK